MFGVLEGRKKNRNVFCVVFEKWECLTFRYVLFFGGCCSRAYASFVKRLCFVFQGCAVFVLIIIIYLTRSTSVSTNYFNWLIRLSTSTSTTSTTIVSNLETDLLYVLNQLFVGFRIWIFLDSNLNFFEFKFCTFCWKFIIVTFFCSWNNWTDLLTDLLMNHS